MKEDGKVSLQWVSRPLLVALLLGGCASPEPKPGSGLAWVSSERQEPVRFLVIHHTASDLQSSLRILSGLDPERRVSSHYLVTDENPPRVIALVPEERVAFHAGVSHWRGQHGLNRSSIGIEIVNLDGNIHDYTEAQVELIGRLCSDIVLRHGIRPENVVAHSDIAPNRKIDPGTRFPWERLHRVYGVGAWPDAKALIAPLPPAPPPVAEFRALLKAWGYPVGQGASWSEADQHALAAFQRRFRPARVDGQPDVESAVLLQALVSQYR